MSERPASVSRNTVLNRATLAELVVLAWPIAAAMAGEVVIGLVDTKLVSGLGTAALGGVGLATTLMFLGYSVVFGLMRGVKVRSAWAIGQGRAADATAYANAGVLLGAACGIAVFILARDASALLRFIGVEPDLARPATDFFAAVTWGAPATAMLAALIQHRQAIGDPRTPMVIGLTGNLFNAALAYTLIYRAGLGVKGAAYATAVTEWLELLAMGAVLWRDTGRAERRPTLGLLRATREVAELGGPTGLQFGAETLAFATFSAVLGTMPSHEVASHQIALSVIRCSFLPGIAVGEAVSVLVGKALGRAAAGATERERRRGVDDADRATGAGLRLAVGFMTACGLIFLLAGKPIARAFTDDAAVIRTTGHLLVVAAIFQVLDAVNIVLRGALRGAKDVRVAALIGIAAVWTCVPVAAWALGRHLGYGALGGWLGFIGETTFGASALWVRWRRAPFRKTARAAPLPGVVQTPGMPESEGIFD